MCCSTNSDILSCALGVQHLFVELATAQAVQRRATVRALGRRSSAPVQAVFGSKTATKTTYVCIDCAHPYSVHCYWPACGKCLAAVIHVATAT